VYHLQTHPLELRCWSCQSFPVPQYKCNPQETSSASALTSSLSLRPSSFQHICASIHRGPRCTRTRWFGPGSRCWSTCCRPRGDTNLGYCRNHPHSNTLDRRSGLRRSRNTNCTCRDSPAPRHTAEAFRHAMDHSARTGRELHAPLLCSLYRICPPRPVTTRAPAQPRPAPQPLPIARPYRRSKRTARGPLCHPSLRLLQLTPCVHTNSCSTTPSNPAGSQRRERRAGSRIRALHNTTIGNSLKINEPV
jgi:hypothetical protein